MSYDILSSSSINNLISSYKYTEQQKLLLPLTSRKTKYQNLSSAYGTLSSKLDSLKSLLNTFKQTGSDSPFTVKKGTSSNEAFVSVSASNAASIGTFNLRVSQMAKNDMLVSQNFASDDVNVTAGLQSFLIKTGDGKGGFFTSNVQVELSSSETNKTILEKIKDAVNADKAVVTSDAKTGSNNYNGGAGSLTIDINGTAHTINYNGGGTYEDLIDEIAGIINTDVSGVSAEKVIDSPNPGDVRLKFTVTDSSKYISVSHSSGFDVVSDLNISANKEKSAQSIISASVFSPNTAQSQFSLTAKETGIDFRIAELSDTGGSSILSAIGLNIGSSRPAFDQSSNP
jgi:flagellar capping protein FliD